MKPIVRLRVYSVWIDKHGTITVVRKVHDDIYEGWHNHEYPVNRLTLKRALLMMYLLYLSNGKYKTIEGHSSK